MSSKLAVKFNRKPLYQLTVHGLTCPLDFWLSRKLVSPLWEQRLLVGIEFPDSVDWSRSSLSDVWFTEGTREYMVAHALANDPDYFRDDED